MNRVERIRNRLPRLYKHWDKDSLIFSLIKAVSKELDEAEEKITDVMKAHWVDTALADELDKIGSLLGLDRLSGEDDSRYRARLKRAVNEYKGGGTVPAILDAVRALIKAEDNDDVKIVENPQASTFSEFVVRAGDTWTIGSNSITDVQPSLTLTVEDVGTVSNPQISNLDTGESITFNGKLKGGQKLAIEKEKAFVDEEDVSEKFLPQKIPTLLRKGSTWQYTESLEKLVGVFDTAKFDEHTFAMRVPSVKIHFDWIRLQPATFEVQIKPKALRDKEFSKPYLEKVVDSMKAAGVNALVEITG
jgi:hypothetical protein